LYELKGVRIAGSRPGYALSRFLVMITLTSARTRGDRAAASSTTRSTSTTRACCRRRPRHHDRSGRRS